MAEKSILLLSKTEQLTYLETLLLTQETEKALSKVLSYENLSLEVNHIINEVINKKSIRKHLKIINGIKKGSELSNYINAMIIAILGRLNKPKVLNEFLKTLGQNKINKLYNYEKIDNQKLLEKYVDKKIISNSDLKQNNKKTNKTIKIVIAVIVLIILGIGVYFGIQDLKLLKYYEDKVYPNFYIYDVDVSEKSFKDLETTIEAMKNDILNTNITFVYNNSKKQYKASELGLTISTDSLVNKLSHYTDNMNIKDKLALIKSNKVKKFTLEIAYEDTKIQNIIDELKKSYNKKKKSGYLKRDNNFNISYVSGTDGFAIDEKKIKEDIIKLLSNWDLEKKDNIITITGTVDKLDEKNTNLKYINKKIASFTTSFDPSGNRGYNVKLSGKKANGTILQPGEVFSYRKVVGPYSGANGYLAAPIQQNGTTVYGTGGGVCQLATTMFNAQLLAGLQTVYRTNHGAPVAYVGRGLDATVAGDDPDYKFKNNYKYPVYISVYTSYRGLTVDIWSNENATEGKTFKPYVVAKSALEYYTYLAVYKNGKQIDTKYISYSYYLK